VIGDVYFFLTDGFVSVWGYGTACASSRIALCIHSSNNCIRACFPNFMTFSDGLVFSQLV